MPIAPIEVQSILSNYFDSQYLKIIGNGARQDFSPTGHLINAGGARALPSQIAWAVRARMPITPGDHQLRAADLFDLARLRTCVRARGHSGFLDQTGTSMICSGVVL
jgi:hypothetical protein